MVEYTKDVADRVLRILQASGQVEEEKMTEIMVRAESRSARALGLIMQGVSDPDDPSKPPRHWSKKNWWSIFCRAPMRSGAKPGPRRGVGRGFGIAAQRYD